MAQPKLVQPKTEKPFVADIEEIRRRARDHIMQGAITSSYEGDVQTAINVLNQALATEIVCTLRYLNHYFMADGIHAKSVADEFREHADEEREHADRLAKRIRELGGEPDMNPANLMTRSHSEYHGGASLIEMIKEDLIAERIAIDSYREIIRYFDVHDPTSRRMMEHILAKEEEHAEDLQTLLVGLDPNLGGQVAS